MGVSASLWLRGNSEGVMKYPIETVIGRTFLYFEEGQLVTRFYCSRGAQYRVLGHG